MKFLLDMGISPRTAEYLRSRGYQAVHLLEQSLHRLPDSEIFEKARNEGSVILTHDLDFADLVAASGSRLPSVVLFRLSNMRPKNVNHHMEMLIERHGHMLEDGAVVSVTERRVRIRSLPFEISGRARRADR